MSRNVMPNREVKDLRDVTTITVNKSKGAAVGYGKVWGEQSEKYVYITKDPQTWDLYSSCYDERDVYTIKLRKVLIDKESGRYVDLIIKGDRVTCYNAGYNGFVKVNKRVLSVDKNNIWINGIDGLNNQDISLEYRYSDNYSLYDKTILSNFIDIDAGYFKKGEINEFIKMGNGFDGDYYVPDTFEYSWKLKQNADGYIGNSTFEPDNDTFATGFCYIVHNGKISFKSSVKDAGTGLNFLAFPDEFGSLKINKVAK